MSERYFVPSQYHLHLMEKTERELAWKGQPFGPWQEALRARLIELLGGFPEERVPLNVAEIEREETDTYVRTKLVFTSEPFADVPGHLFVPKGADGPRPAMICLQGHSPGMHISIGVARDENDRESIAGDRDIAIQAGRNGLVTLAIEQRSFGERAETLQEHRSETSCQEATMHSLLLGRTMIAERTWDVMRAIDLLEGLPEVDSSRIACMGNSGGGTITFYTACLEPRLKLAVVSCFFCTYADSIMRIYHCEDNYIPGILKVAEMGELAGLIPPRKLLVVAGREDGIFPIAGVGKAFNTAREIFSAAGCPDNLDMVIGEGGHRFYAEQSWPVIRRMLEGGDNCRAPKTGGVRDQRTNLLRKHEY